MRLLHRLTAVTACLLLVTLCCLRAAAAAQEEVARLYSNQGQVEAKLAGSKEWTAAATGTIFYADDAIRIGRHGRAGILFTDGVLVRLSSGVLLTFQQDASGANNLKADAGKFYFFSRKPQRHPQIKTPTVSASVRGTEFALEVTPEETIISVIDGSVECSNRYGTVNTQGGEQAVAALGTAPVKSVLLNPYDAVQWTLHYNSLLGLSDLADFPLDATDADLAGMRALQEGDVSDARKLFISPTWQSAAGQALCLQAAGKNIEALDSLEAFKGPRKPGFLLVEAEQNLLLGAYPRAKAVLSELFAELPSLPAEIQEQVAAAAYAQRVVLALIDNNKADALATVERAYRLNPKSESVLLALTFVKQAHFDLAAAGKHIEELLAIHPSSSYALAKLAELELAANNVKQAAELISKAQSLDPNNSYILTIAGFVKLFENFRTEAQKLFTKAAEIDSSLALARLGAGLAKIKGGDLRGGQLEISKAVHLAPTTSIYRSYLGKAFFEQGEEGLAESEYEQAIALDPKDPTPYLYRSFNKLSQNQVVGALADVEKSIELNNNRAVYRSQLMLDRDLGMRSASLAKVFDNLGFEQAARLEAVKSVYSDYTNYSAHRFLADSSDSILLADAGFSERRIANLLAPLSFNFLNDDTIGEASLNEYSALFDRSQNRTNLEAEYDSQYDAGSGRFGFAGKTDYFGYYLSAAGRAEGGSKDNDYRRLYQAKLGLQYQPSYQDLFVLEASSNYDRQNLEDQEILDRRVAPVEATLGYRHTFDPHNTLLAQIGYLRARYNHQSPEDRMIGLYESLGDEAFPIADPYDLFIQESTQDTTDLYDATLQYLYNTDSFSAVLGLEGAYSDIERQEESPIIDDPALFFPDINRKLDSSGPNKLNSVNTYLYTKTELCEYADLDLGVAYTDLETELRDIPPYIEGTHTQSRWNPKIGLLLYPVANLTVRGAYFETLWKSSFEAQSSLEPTLVGGFNQRFNDFPGTKSENYGVGLDYKLPTSTYIGAEWLDRKLTQPFGLAGSAYIIDFDSFEEVQQQDSFGVINQDRDEQLSRAYLYQVINQQWVGTLDYYYYLDKLNDPLAYEKVRGQRVATTLRYFSPRQWYAYARGTWRDQDRVNSSVAPDGSSSFWLFDLAMGYRIPKQQGAIELQFLNIFNQDWVYDPLIGVDQPFQQGFGVRLLGSFNF